VTSKASVSVTVSPQGVGFCGALFLVFLVLQLTEVIDWSWWWITAPLWIPFVLVMGFFVLLLAVAGLAK